MRMHSQASDCRRVDPAPVIPLVPRVCVLFGTTGGDNAQLLNLAKALRWPFEVKGEVDSVPMTVLDRMAQAACISLRRSKPLLSSLLWPDLILIAGGRRVVDAHRIKAMSEGRSKIVALGRPWADLDLFDLVITTPQYRLPARDNVLVNAMPLNQPSAAALRQAADGWRADLDHLPRPWTTLLVGGSSGSCRFTEETAPRLAEEANRVARSTGGSVLISTSARTPVAAADALIAGIEGPHISFRWDRQARRNPHAAFLALADRFIVTGDSASMIAEAVSTGRPVSIFEIPLRRHSRWMTGKRRSSGPGERLRQRLIERGWWIPARDMTAYRDNLIECGYVADRTSTDQPFGPKRPDDLERAVRAIQSLFPSLPRGSEEETDCNMTRKHTHGLAIAS